MLGCGCMLYDYSMANPAHGQGYCRKAKKSNLPSVEFYPCQKIRVEDGFIIILEISNF